MYTETEQVLSINCYKKTILSLFLEYYRSQIKLAEKDEVLQDDGLIAKDINELFKNVVSISNIKENSLITTEASDEITYPVDKTIDKYKFHVSILLIRKRLKI